MSKKNVQKKERTLPTVERTIMNKRATVIFWCDGTKTVVKRRKGEKQNRELAVLYAIAEKVLGGKKARSEFIEAVTDGKYENECECCRTARTSRTWSGRPSTIWSSQSGRAARIGA